MCDKIRMVDIDSFQAVGLATALTRSHTKNFGIISNLWKRFNAQIHNIGNRPEPESNWVKFGITYALDNEYRYLAAIQYLDNMRVPKTMTKKVIAPGQYACFTHRGKLTRLKSTVNNIYKRILPAKNITPEPLYKAGLIQFEKYDNRFHWNRSDSIIEIYVPIEILDLKI